MPKKMDDRFELRMSKQDSAAFQKAADVYGIPLALWLRLAAWKVVLSSSQLDPVEQPQPLERRLELRMRSDEKASFLKQAKKLDVSLGEWIRRAAWHVIKKHDGEVELVKIK